jgi:hypothetical protein
VAPRAGEEIQGAEDTHNPPTRQLTRSRHVEDAEGIGNEQVASDPRDQERASLPGRSAISAHQILNNLDLGGPTINNAELRKIADDERVILCDSINHEERFDETASGARAKSRAARGMVESDSNSSGYALAGEGDINPESPPALAVDDRPRTMRRYETLATRQLPARIALCGETYPPRGPYATSSVMTRCTSRPTWRASSWRLRVHTSGTSDRRPQVDNLRGLTLGTAQTRQPAAASTYPLPIRTRTECC